MICIGGWHHGQYVDAKDVFNGTIFLVKPIAPQVTPVLPGNPANNDVCAVQELYKHMRYGTKNGGAIDFMGCQNISGEELLRLCRERFKHS